MTGEEIYFKWICPVWILTSFSCLSLFSALSLTHPCVWWIDLLLQQKTVQGMYVLSIYSTDICYSQIKTSRSNRPKRPDNFSCTGRFFIVTLFLQTWLSLVFLLVDRWVSRSQIDVRVNVSALWDLPNTHKGSTMREGWVRTLGLCVRSLNAALLQRTPISPPDNMLVTSSEMFHTPGTGFVLSTLTQAPPHTPPPPLPDWTVGVHGLWGMRTWAAP